MSYDRNKTFKWISEFTFSMFNEVKVIHLNYDPRFKECYTFKTGAWRTVQETNVLT